MALMITEDCVNCDVCLPECPSDAITDGSDAGVDVYHINPNLCTECVGYFDNYQACAQEYPIECIVPNPNKQETKTQLQAKYDNLR